MKVKSGQLFWGTLLLVLGGLILLSKYELICFDWHYVLDLWPLVIVFLGLFVITKGTIVKPIVSFLFGIFVAALIFGSISDLFCDYNFEWDIKKDYRNETFIEGYDSDIKFAELEISSAAGLVMIKEPSQNLMEGFSNTSGSDYYFKTRTHGSTTSIEFDLENSTHNFFRNDLNNNLSLNLNENPIWDFDIGLGGAKGKFDLSYYKVRDIRLETGAAKVFFKLGDKYPSTNVNVEIGVATIEFNIPKTSACMLTGDMVLVSKNLDGFEKRKSGVYVTENYTDAENKIIIDINGGVSSLKINRY